MLRRDVCSLKLRRILPRVRCRHIPSQLRRLNVLQLRFRVLQYVHGGDVKRAMYLVRGRQAVRCWRHSLRGLPLRNLLFRRALYLHLLRFRPVPSSLRKFRLHELRGRLVSRLYRRLVLGELR